MSAPPFESVLIANRGEIAVRICRTLREMGIRTIAVHSNADLGAPHVRAADEAVDLGGDTPAESYLIVEKVIAAAKERGAEAIHPGYGFLSENAAFAQAVADAGMTFIGPSPAAMQAVGGKREARAAAEAAGVPVVPGAGGEGDAGTDEALIAAAEQIGFPVMVKASGGGGGKGMRRVDRAEDVADAIAAGRREAQSAFGDPNMLVEKLVQPARHIEIQVLGDLHGNAVSLHERECSVQRRHQKVLEEAPSPVVDAAMRQRMGAASVALCKQVGYANAGTVEFLADNEGNFYFLEVNTRLQVEHPVTECITGLDLVRCQVLLAAGAKLTELFPDGVPAPRGHAIEARIYAEQPENGYLPAAGLLERVVEPEGPGVRVDTGVETGSVVSVHYDPMLAKLIVHAPDRAAACERMARALRASHYMGIPTNTDFLARVVDHADFRSGDLRIDFLDLNPDLAPGPQDEAADAELVALALSRGLVGAPGAASSSGGGGNDGPAADPWRDLGPTRLWMEVAR